MLKRKGAVLLLIGTILMTVAFVWTFVGLFGLGATIDSVVQKQAAEQGLDNNQTQLVLRTMRIIVYGSAILGLVPSLLTIIPGWIASFSKKCITWAFVMAIIEIISVAISFVGAIASGGILSTIIGAAAAILYIIGAIMLRKDAKAGA